MKKAKKESNFFKTVIPPTNLQDLYKKSSFRSAFSAAYSKSLDYDYYLSTITSSKTLKELKKLIKILPIEKSKKNDKKDLSLIPIAINKNNMVNEEEITLPNYHFSNLLLKTLQKNNNKTTECIEILSNNENEIREKREIDNKYQFNMIEIDNTIKTVLESYLIYQEALKNEENYNKTYLI